MESNRGRRVTLSEVVIVVLIVGVLAAMLIPFLHTAVRHTRMVKDEGHISQLLKACYNYSVTKTPVPGNFHDDVLREAWIERLYESGEVTDPSVFWCTQTDFHIPGRTNYRGPEENPNTGPGDMILIADRPENHSKEPDAGICYALKSGSCHKVPHNSPMWTTTLRTWVEH